MQLERNSKALIEHIRRLFKTYNLYASEMKFIHFIKHKNMSSFHGIELDIKRLEMKYTLELLRFVL